MRLKTHVSSRTFLLLGWNLRHGGQVLKGCRACLLLSRTGQCSLKVRLVQQAGMRVLVDG
jgi:hypothetical protein